ncbi:5220_t:CDS:2 [Cetraspora pellucida]|uniref:5220_t:CDS:1 n=1 Tax=Cetraspora pellucida TaxID=1433469 RepID=A0A9N9J877_9GLOM|nr:5220_t:CDS:2 [Cetraspora pellucida]
MSQGQVEHLNQTVECGFTKMFWNEDLHLQNVNWKDYLLKFVFSYNTIQHSVNEKISCEVLFGYKLLDITNHLKKVSTLHDQVNKQLDKSRKQMQKHSSVHHHNNLYKPYQLVAIAPNTNMNPTTQKRKLQTNFKNIGTIVGIINNNKTIVVETSNTVSPMLATLPLLVTSPLLDISLLSVTSPSLAESSLLAALSLLFVPSF